MKTFKSKSLSNATSDWEIETGTHSVRFISFEAVVRNFQDEFKIDEKPIGYIVTEQGVEIIYE